MGRKHPSPASGSSGINFIEMKNPSDKSWHRTVRSHAARRYYSEARLRHIQRPGITVPKCQKHDSQRTGCTYARNSLSDCSLGGPEQNLFHNYQTPCLKWQTTNDPWMLPRMEGIDPFNTLARPTTRFENYLFNHYVTYVMAKANMCEDIPREDYIRFPDEIHQLQLAAADDGLLHSIMLSSCRSLASLGVSGPFLENTHAYKGACIRSVNKAISSNQELPSVATIITTLSLASESYLENDMAAAEQHCRAIEIMVNMRGGPQGFRKDQFMEVMVKFVVGSRALWPGDLVWRNLRALFFAMP